MKIDEFLKLAKMTGTKKQILWAEDIREKFAKEYIKEVEDHHDFSDDELEKIKTVFEVKDSASWWIDIRMGDLDTLLLAYR